jgi:hypothetical protein
MLVPVIVIAFVAAIWAAWVYLGGRVARRGFWRTALLTGLAIGVSRAVLASIGWYTVEHTGGPLQIPGFLLAMMAWPEAALLAGRHRTRSAPPALYAALSALLIGSSVLFVTVIAGLARLASRRRGAG